MKVHKQNKNTSWEESSSWYNELVGTGGHYYHQNVILPKLKSILNLKKGDSLLDIGCGQGVLERMVPKEIKYLGIDASQTLIEQAQKNAVSPHKFMVADATKPFEIPGGKVSHAIALLSLQNMREPGKAIELASKNLTKGGTFVMVLNHPYFRIPRQSGWGTFEESKLQYRWITKYMSEMEIPFVTHLPKGKSIHSWSFHHPFESYVSWLKKSGLAIVDLQEWTSDKESFGRHAKKENRSRAEIPLFMCVVAKKI